MADEQLIKPRELPAATTVFADDAIMTDNGSIVGKATPVQIVNAGAPVPTEAEAIAGTDNSKRMTPLAVKQVLDSVTAPSVLRAQAWAESDSPPNPGIPGSMSAKSWAAEAERLGSEQADRAAAAAATSGARYVKDANEFFSTDVDDGLWLSYEGYSWEVTSTGGRFPHPISGKGVQPFPVPEGHSVKAHGAVTNRWLPDADIYENTDASAVSDGVAVVFDADIAPKRQTIFSARKWVGLGGWVRVPSDFVDPGHGDRRDYGMFMHSQNSTVYDTDTALDFECSGLVFYCEALNGPREMQGFFILGNTKRVKIWNNSFLYDPEYVFSHPLAIKLGGAVKGLDIYENVFWSRAADGGTFWMQGYTGGPSDPENASENIHFYRNTVYQDGGAEPLAAWGAGGIIQDFSFRDNHVHIKNVPTPISILSSISAANTHSFSRRGSIVGNTFILENVNVHGIVIGSQYLSHQTSDIDVLRNNMVISGTAASETQGYAVRVRYNVQNVNIDDNTLICMGDHVVSRGISKDGTAVNVKARRNTIRGFRDGITNLDENIDNDIEATNIGHYNCLVVKGGKSKALVPYRVAGTSTVFPGKMHSLSGRAYLESTATGSSQNAYVSGTVDCIMEDLEAFGGHSSIRGLLSQGSGVRILRNADFTGQGNGLEADAAAIPNAHGNTWYGVRDDVSESAAAIPSYVRTKYKLGHFVKNSNPQIVVGEMVTGWVLYDDAGTRKWAQISAPAV